MAEEEDGGGAVKRESQVVLESDARPDKGNDVCCWCDGKVGEEHRPGCVCRERTVVLETTILFVATVPEDWDEEAIEFQYNGSSRCADNTIHDLVDLVDSDSGCSCCASATRFVREATEDDVLKRFPCREEVL
jgi:hypothetical protein